MKRLILEADGIETLEQLRAAITDLPDDTPVSDGLGQPLLLSYYQTDSVNEGGTYPDLKYIELT